MSDLHPVFREITQSFFLTPPPDSGSRVDPHAAVVESADSPMPVVEPARQVQQVQPERMSLWRINHLLAPLELSHQTLADLGFYAAYPLGATLAGRPNYSASDFPKICRAISDHALAAAKGELK